MESVDRCELWFVTGSQRLYGDDVLKQVAQDAETVIKKLIAKTGQNCAGLVYWMHMFSPATMWITRLSMLRKPMAW